MNNNIQTDEQRRDVENELENKCSRKKILTENNLPRKKSPQKKAQIIKSAWYQVFFICLNTYIRHPKS